MNESIWQNCYVDNWSGDIVPSAFQHPAKFSRGLIHRIYKHAKEMGWVKAGDYVLDPFGGVALGGLDAISMGLNWIGVELEIKFVELGWKNINKWYLDLKGWPNLGTARLINADSRRLKYAIKEKVDLVVSSPPYSDIINRDRDQEGYAKSKNIDHFQTQGANNQSKSYGHTPGNLANMKEGSFDLCVSSPPWEDSTLPKNTDNLTKRAKFHAEKTSRNFKDYWIRSETGNYGQSKNQLGNISGDTFWSASHEIVQGCYELLKPEGHAIWVCKDYIKNKKRVPFSQRWATLCESVGFKIVCWHKAMLVKEHGTQITTDGKDEVIQTSRKSFFRRLAESKGSPRIDWEDVICMVK